MTRSLFNALNVIKVFGASLVVASHYAPHYIGTSFYSYGTGCFFVVTGYYALNWERSRGVLYLAKRLIRLYPAFLIAVLAYLITRRVPLEEWPYLISHHLTFLLTTPDRATAFALNPPFWSLPVFFTFFALVAFLPRKATTGWQVLGLAAVATVALLLEVTRWREGYIELWAFPLHLYAFWLGGWVGYRAHHHPGNKHMGYMLSAGGLMLLAVVGGIYYREITDALFGGEGFIYRGAMVLIYGALLWSMIHSPWIDRELPLLTLLATISFGVYLFHNLPVYWFSGITAGPVGMLISLSVSMCLAWLSWRYVEYPFQKWSKPRLADFFSSGIKNNND